MIVTSNIVAPGWQNVRSNFDIQLVTGCPDFELNFCSALGTDCTVSFCDTRFNIFGMHPLEFMGEVMVFLFMVGGWMIIFKGLEF